MNTPSSTVVRGGVFSLLSLMASLGFLPQSASRSVY